MTKARLDALAATARALLEQLEALRVEAAEPAKPPLLDLKQAHATYGVSRFSLLAAQERGELSLHRGPHQRILVDRDALEAWLRSRPHVRRPKAEYEPENEDAWEKRTDNVLRAITGGRRS